MTKTRKNLMGGTARSEAGSKAWGRWTGKPWRGFRRQCESVGNPRRSRTKFSPVIKRHGPTPRESVSSGRRRAFPRPGRGLVCVDCSTRAPNCAGKGSVSAEGPVLISPLDSGPGGKQRILEPQILRPAIMRPEQTQVAENKCRQGRRKGAVAVRLGFILKRLIPAWTIDSAFCGPRELPALARALGDCPHLRLEGTFSILARRRSPTEQSIEQEKTF